jgi:hypothetical protein
VLLGSGAAADTLTDATISIDARDPAAVAVTHRVTWRVDDAAFRKGIEFFLAPEVRVSAVGSEGESLPLDRRDVPGGNLVGWSVRLPSPLSSGGTRVLEIETVVRPEGGPGIRSGPDGGRLLPGSGWFPRLTPEAGERVPHSLSFDLPAGMTGIAAGTAGSAAEPWVTDNPVRPFASWGRWTRTTPGEGFVAYRRAESTGEIPRLDRIASLLDILATGAGEAVGEGNWKLVDVGDGVLAGGARTLLWDESAFGSESDEAKRALLDRDLAGALAASYWAECMRFTGEYAAWMSGGVTRYLGDLAAIVHDRGDETIPVEARIIGSRRAAFLEGRGDDRPLRGLIPGSAETERHLDTRGALVAHTLAECAWSRGDWVVLLNVFRREHLHAAVDWAALKAAAAERFSLPFHELDPLLDGTDLPDFRIVDHEPEEGRQGPRYRVDVENVGQIAASVDVAAFAADGELIWNSRVYVPAGGMRSQRFIEAGRVARIVIDPRGLVPQLRLDDEVVERTGAGSGEPWVPSFRFSTSASLIFEVPDLTIELNGITISGFHGALQKWQTPRGPTGASLIGEGKVTIAPPGDLAADFRENTGSDRLTFDVGDIWIRFPPAKWGEIEPQIGSYVGDSAVPPLVRRARAIHRNAALDHYQRGIQALLPPPGGALACFALEGESLRCFLAQPNPDGTTSMRLWDHPGGETLWESTR